MVIGYQRIIGYKTVTDKGRLMCPQHMMGKLYILDGQAIVLRLYINPTIETQW